MKPKNSEAAFATLDWGKYKFICLESNRIAECMEYYQKEKLDGLYISAEHGYKRKRLTFLKDYPFIKRVVINYSSDIQVSDLEDIPKLRLISISKNKHPIDFSAFPHLEELTVEWHQKMVFPESSKTLKDLRMWSYKPKPRDFTDLPDLPNLESLEMIRPLVDSLAGLGRFKKLKVLKLAYISKLERIAELDAYSLERLEFDVCRKITDHEHVTNFPKLEHLQLTDCGSVPSLEFLNHMPALRIFTFVDTNVLDGDMTPCFRLDCVGTLDKKHYSHTDDEIYAIITERKQKEKKQRGD